MFLWALVGIPLLAAFLVHAHRRRARALAEFAEAGLLSRLAPDVAPRRRVVRDALRLAALLAGIVALAGPRWGFHWEEVRREGVDLIIALDTSKSMLAVDVKPNRLERAKLAVLDLLRLLKGDRVGLVAFAGTAFLQCPLTLDYDAFAQSLEAVDAGIIPRGGTALGRAIDTAIAAFEGRQGKHAALILITDGEDHEGDVEAAVTRAAEHDIKIFTVGIGTVEGELIPLAQGQPGFLKDRDGMVVKSRLDEGALRTIAEKTGGAYLRSSGDALGLDVLFSDHIAAMERRELESAIERRFEDRFQLPLLLALLLLCAEALLGDRAGAWQSLRLRAWRLRRRAGRASGPAPALVIVCALANLGWFGGERDSATEGNRLYDAERYGDAVTAYGEGLSDRPGSERLRFNLGAAQYKSNAYEDALATLKKLAPDPDPAAAPTARPGPLAGRAAYNMGNARFRLAQQSEAKDLAGAIALCKEALVAYKRAMGADPGDDDAKFNHEFVARHLADLEKKLEEQQRQQQEQAADQPQGEQQRQPGQDEPKPDEQGAPDEQDESGQDQEQQAQQEQQEQQEQRQEGQAAEQQKPEDGGSAAEQPEDGAGEEQARQDGTGGADEPEQPETAQAPPPQAGGEEPRDGADQQAAQPGQGGAGASADAEAADGADGAMTAADAHALIDAARGEEVDPKEIPRRLEVPATIGEAAREW
jgi:Ca-activated chloride channel family protein